MLQYLIIISVTAAIITVYDKLAAKLLPRHRIPEKLLMLTALSGGAAAQYLTMQIIRHKTRHKKFMTGLPVMIVFHIIIIALLYRFIF